MTRNPDITKSQTVSGRLLRTEGDIEKLEPEVVLREEFPLSSSLRDSLPRGLAAFAQCTSGEKMPDGLPAGDAYPICTWLSSLPIVAVLRCGGDYSLQLETTANTFVSVPEATFGNSEGLPEDQLLAGLWVAFGSPVFPPASRFLNANERHIVTDEPGDAPWDSLDEEPPEEWFDAVTFYVTADGCEYLRSPSGPIGRYCLGHDEFELIANSYDEWASKFICAVEGRSGAGRVTL